MRVWQRQSLLAGLIAALALGGMVGVAAGVVGGLGGWSVAVGAGAAALILGASLRRPLRRVAALRRPFPEAHRERLESCVPFYRRLDEEGRRRFEADVQIFLAEQRISGVRGAPVPEDAKVLVAASAAMLGHGLPDWEWPTLRDIVIYPSAFDEEYATGEGGPILGMVHHQGPILLSGPELAHGFCTGGDGHNVGLHEMAHVLDMADGHADGVPAGVAWVAEAPWVETVADRLARVRGGQLRKVLRAYAGKNEAELFAVSVETFFEKPDRLAESDPELYDMLADFFNLDPRTARPLRPI